MWLWKFFRKFSLPCSLVLGAVGYLIFANVPFLEPLGDAVGPKLVDLMPVVLFALLYVTFCKIEIKEMKPKAWHFVLQLIRTSLALAMVVLIFEFGDDYETKLVLEGAFICFICPTAAAVAVVTEKLGGSIGSLTTYTVIANVFTMVIIPIFPDGGEGGRCFLSFHECDGVQKRNHGTGGAFAPCFAEPQVPAQVGG